MFLITFSNRINQNLIRFFDQSRIRYMILVFPAYQLLALAGIAAVIFSFEAVGTSPYFAPLWLILAILIGVPLLASWHLSCLLFSIGYFGFFAWLGIPFTPWVTKQLEGAVNWFRSAQ